MHVSETARVLVDGQHPQAHQAQLELAGAVRSAAAAVGLDRSLVELVNTRLLQLNRCACCLNVHVRDALRGGETALRLRRPAA